MHIQTLPILDPRIPQWDLNQIVDRPCPICNTLATRQISSGHVTGPNFIRPDNLLICRCAVCSTFYISPAPTEMQLSLFYENYSNSHVAQTDESPQGYKKKIAKEKPTDDYRIQTILKIFDKTDINVLDIGCGRGTFLFKLKQLGFNPFGVEIESKAIPYAHALGIQNIFNGVFNDYDNNAQFELITLLDLIEHPLLPMEILNKACTLLKPGGMILIWTPNGDFGSDNPEHISFRVDLEHMQFLTKKSCEFIAKQLNLNISYLETIGLHLGFQNLDGSTKVKPTSNRNSLLGLKKIVQKIPGAIALLHAIKNYFTNARDNSISHQPLNEGYHLFCILQKPLTYN